VKALIAVDIEKDFCEGGKLAVRGGSSVAVNTAKYLKQHGNSYELLIATKDWHLDPGSHWSDKPDFIDSWPVHCQAGTPGADFHDALSPWDFDHIIAVLGAEVRDTTTELAMTHPVHVWLHLGDRPARRSLPLGSMVRSFIVDSDEAASDLRRSFPDGPPIVVVPRATDDIVASWTFDDVAILQHWGTEPGVIGATTDDGRSSKRLTAMVVSGGATGAARDVPRPMGRVRAVAIGVGCAA